MLKVLAVMAVCGVLLAGCAKSAARPTPSREERVRSHFTGSGESIAEKEGLASPAAVGYVMVDEERLPDGTVRSLWVTTPGTFRSRCHYLDVELPDGATYGVGGCGGGRDERRVITIGGNAAEMVGSVSGWDAAKARIEAGGLEALVPVKGGYFLVPDKLAKTGATRFAVTLLDGGMSVVAGPTEVKPPWAAP